MNEHLIFDIGIILASGIAAQWLAWRIHLPSILLLLLAGFTVGPILHLAHPDELLGELLTPLVSLSVAVILFEGGLALRFSDLRGVQRAVWGLISAGALITWGCGTVFAHALLGLEWRLALLFGGMLIVTGPTVVIPLLRFVRPAPRVGSILKWEGILIDPVGALMTVLIFEAILEAAPHSASRVIAAGIFKTVIFGSLCGAAGAALLYLMVRKFWAPDFLHNPLTLALVVCVYLTADWFQPEAGLMAVTLMGILLANQKKADIHHIIDFKEDVVVILISCLFVVLAARVDLAELWRASLGGTLFLAATILISRPLAALGATVGSGLPLNERLFIAWMAPRGIVAAAIASVFALRLQQQGMEQAERLVPYTFMVIIGTVLIYGLSARPAGRWLGVAKASPQGVLFLGAYPWVRRMALALKEAGIHAMLVDSNRRNVYAARMEGLTAHYGNVFSEFLGLEGVGRLAAMTPNDEVNSLAALHFESLFGRAEVYQLPPDERQKSDAPQRLRGRYLFNKNATFDGFASRYSQGWTVKKTPLTEEFGFGELMEYYQNHALPLFLIKENGNLRVMTLEDPPEPEAGDELISLVKENDPTA